MNTIYVSVQINRTYIKVHLVNLGVIIIYCMSTLSLHLGLKRQKYQ